MSVRCWRAAEFGMRRTGRVFGIDIGFHDETVLVLAEHFGQRFIILRVRDVAAAEHRIRLDKDRKSTRLNSSHSAKSRMPSSA